MHILLLVTFRRDHKFQDSKSSWLSLIYDDQSRTGDLRDTKRNMRHPDPTGMVRLMPPAGPEADRLGMGLAEVAKVMSGVGSDQFRLLSS